MSYIKELKRRKVIRVAVAYVIVAWLIAQVTELALDSFATPDWVMKTVLYLLVIGFPLALIFAWAFEATPSGIHRDRGSAEATSRDVRPLPAGRTRYVALVIAGAIAVGLAIGGYVGRTTVEVPEIVETSKTPIQLTANPSKNPVVGSAISPDGKYLAYAEVSGLFLRVIQSGESHQIPTPESLLLGRTEIDWFPDGTHLLITARTATESNLWKLAIVGGPPRKLMDRVSRAAISPDGSKIAVLPYRRANEIYLMGPEGENPTKLVDVENEAIWEIGWSPNGKFILFGAGLTENQTLRAVDVTAGDVTVVMRDNRTFQNWRGFLPFHWAPDGRLLYARRDPRPSSEISNLWQVELDTETAQVIGEPRQITRLTGYNFRDVSITTDASKVAFLLEENQSDVYVGEIHDGGRRLDNVRRLTRDDRNDWPGGWSADSQGVYFYSERGASDNVFIKSIFEGSAKALTGSLVAGEGAIESSPDGKWLLYWEQTTLMKMPLEGGPSEIVHEGTPSSDLRCPSNLAIGTDCVISMREANNQYVFYAFNPEYGLGKKLASVEDSPPFSTWAMSPDGKHAALMHNKGRVRIIDLESGSEREFSRDGWQFGEFVEWARDGKGLFMDGYASSAMFRKSLIYTSMETGEVIEIRREPNQWHILPKASPDGKYLAFGLMIFSGNVWMIEDL